MNVAEQWTAKHDFRVPVAVIVGLGSGEHVRTWLDAHPDSRVIVVEVDSATASAWKKSDRCDIVLVGSVEELAESFLLDFVARELPPVMAFRPAFGSRAELFDSIFATLTGRNRRGLNFFLRHFGFAEESVEEIDGGRLLTIKDLGVVIDTLNEGHPQATAVRVLRELVI